MQPITRPNLFSHFAAEHATVGKQLGRLEQLYAGIAKAIITLEQERQEIKAAWKSEYKIVKHQYSVELFVWRDFYYFLMTRSMIYEEKKRLLTLASQDHNTCIKIILNENKNKLKTELTSYSIIGQMKRLNFSEHYKNVLKSEKYEMSPACLELVKPQKSKASRLMVALERIESILVRTQEENSYLSMSVGRLKQAGESYPNHAAKLADLFLHGKALAETLVKIREKTEALEQKYIKKTEERRCNLSGVIFLGRFNRDDADFFVKKAGCTKKVMIDRHLQYFTMLLRNNCAYLANRGGFSLYPVVNMEEQRRLLGLDDKVLFAANKKLLDFTQLPK